MDFESKDSKEMKNLSTSKIKSPARMILHAMTSIELRILKFLVWPDESHLFSCFILSFGVVFFPLLLSFLQPYVSSWRNCHIREGSCPTTYKVTVWLMKDICRYVCLYNSA